MVFTQVVFVVFFMYVWFDTSALVDYVRFLGLSRWFGVREWEEYREKNPKMEYLSFVARKGGFYRKMVSCKQCLCMWISALTCLPGLSFAWMPAVYLGALLTYNIYVYILWKLRRS